MACHSIRPIHLDAPLLSPFGHHLPWQAEEASSLLRRAEDKMSKLARKTTLRKTISQGRRASTAMAFARRASTAQELAKRQEIANRASRPSTSRRPGYFFGLPTPCELVRRLRAFLADHLSTRSSSAKNEGRNPRPRVKKYDRRTALLVGIICVLVVPIPLVTSRWPRARLGLLGLEARSTNRTDAYDFTSAWCDGDLDVRNFTALERCVRETQELRAEIQLQDEAAAFMVAYATAPGVLLQALQAVVVFVPLLCCLLAPLTFWPLFEHNVESAPFHRIQDLVRVVIDSRGSPLVLHSYVILGYLARQTQVRLTVLTQTVSFLLIAVNALFLGATDMPGVFEPAYIAVDALIMYICIACLICGDALHCMKTCYSNRRSSRLLARSPFLTHPGPDVGTDKPPYTLGTVYVFTVSAMVMNFVSRRTFKVAREQTVLMAREQSVMMDFDLTVQNVLELLDTSTLAIVVSNCFDFFSNRRLTAWAPIKLTRHDLLNSIYLEKVRHAFFERSKLYRLLGLRSTAVEQKLGAQLGLDAAALNHIVVYIQTRWRARQERRRMRERGTARARRRWTLVANVSRSAGVLGSCSNLSAAGSLTESSQTSIVKGSAGDHICNEMKRSKVRQRRRVDLSSLGRSFKLPNGGEAAPSTAPNRQRRRRVSEQARAPLGVPASVVQERMRRSLSRVGSALGTRAKDLDAVVEHPADQVTIDDSTQPIQSKLRSQVREVQESEQELRSYENDPFGDWLGDLDD